MMIKKMPADILAGIFFVLHSACTIFSSKIEDRLRLGNKNK